LHVTPALPPEPINQLELMDRISGDFAFLSELTEIFRIEYPKKLEHARVALAEGDSDGLMRAAHALRGTLANLAATGSSATGAELEQIGHSGELSMAGPILERFEEELKAVMNTLETLCEKAAQ